MPVIFDTGALVRPVFMAVDFVATKWDTADEKALFANSLCKFIASDFQQLLFTQRIYQHLSMSFGHIAHHNRQQFFAVFFEDLRGKVDFLEQTMSWHPWGDPAWTYADVERAVLKRLHACDLLTAYRALRAAEIDGAERALLRRLQAKYEGGEPAVQAPVLHCPVSMKATPASRKPSEQTSLF